MFKKQKDKELDITNLNQIIRTSNSMLKIVYFMIIIILILLGTYIVKEWNIIKYIKEILIVISPVFIGFILAWLLEPLVSWLENKKIPRLAACIIIFVLLLGILFSICYLFIPTLISQLRDFVNVAPNIFDNLINFIMNIINKFDTNNIINHEKLSKNLTNLITNYGLSISSQLPKYILSIGSIIINKGIKFALALMIGFYLLYDFKKVKEYLYNLLPNTWKEPYKELTERINTSLRNYVQGVLLVMSLVFITQSIGLTIAGMEAPIIFALFCAVTDIIPYFGPYIGAIPAVIVAFTISPITGICVIITILIVQLLENNFYQPLIMGHTMKLHPVTIIIGLLLFEHFFGIIGMVIATPVIACLKVFINFFNEKFNLKEKIINEK